MGELTNALSVAKAILSRSHQFEESRLHCFESADIKSFDISVKDKEARLDDAETTIVNFPRWDVRIGKFLCRHKMSLTVCRYGQRSKVWSRMTLLEVEDQEAAGISASTVGDFYKTAESLMNCTLKAAYKNYGTTLSDMGVSRELKLHYNFRFRGVNTHDENTSRLLNMYQSGQIGDLGDALDREDLSHPIAALYAFAQGVPGYLQYSSKDIASDPDWNWSILSGYDQLESLAAVLAIHTDLHMTKAECLCYSPAGVSRQVASAELATKVLLRRYAERF